MNLYFLFPFCRCCLTFLISHLHCYRTLLAGLPVVTVPLLGAWTLRSHWRASSECRFLGPSYDQQHSQAHCAFLACSSSLGLTRGLVAQQTCPGATPATWEATKGGWLVGSVSLQGSFLDAGWESVEGAGPRGEWSPGSSQDARARSSEMRGMAGSLFCRESLAVHHLDFAPLWSVPVTSLDWRTEKYIPGISDFRALSVTNDPAVPPAWATVVSCHHVAFDGFGNLPGFFISQLVLPAPLAS